MNTNARSGYLVYFNNSSKLPKITTYNNSTKSITISDKVQDSKYNGVDIDSEVLTEQVIYDKKNSDGTWDVALEEYKYVYNITHDKYYYDDNTRKFFKIATGVVQIDGKDVNIREKKYIDNSDITYKSVSVLLDEATYKNIYNDFFNDPTDADNYQKYNYKGYIKIYKMLDNNLPGWWIDINEDRKNRKFEIRRFDSRII